MEPHRGIVMAILLLAFAWQASLSAAQTDITNYITIGSSRYATMDNTQQSETASGCQDTYMSLPAGWSVASASDDNAKIAIATGRWGTICLVLSDGSSYRTHEHNVGCGSGQLDSSADGLKVVSCSRRILVSQASDVEDEDFTSITIDQPAAFDHIEYAALDNTPFDSSDVGCQQRLIAIPSGWQIAADDDSTRAALADIDSPFGTQILVLEGGVGVYSSTGVDYASSDNGQLLQQVGDLYNAAKCYMRVLISRVNTNAVDTNAVAYTQIDAITNFVVVGSKRYATIDNAPTDASDEVCQSGYYQLPTGWSIATDDQQSVAAIAAAEWNTRCLVVASGKSYWSGSGQDCFTSNLENDHGDQRVEVHKPSSCSATHRILITQEALLVDGDVDSTIGPQPTNIGHYAGIDYATLDNSAVDVADSGCQTNVYRVPSGWSLASDSAVTVNNLAIIGARFETTCLVLDTGNSYYVSGYASCGDGQIVSFELDDGAFAYKVSGCARRVVISRDNNDGVDSVAVDYTEGTVTNFVNIGGTRYATIDNVDPSSSDIGCTDSYYSLPDGWALADPGDNVYSALIMRDWGTQCLIASNGDATEPFPSFASCGEGELEVAYGDNNLPVYKARTCGWKKRVLLQQPGQESDERTDTLGDVTIDNVVHYNDMDYATIDNSPVDGSSGCQTIGLVVPDGWVIAEDNAETRTAISSVDTTFSTTCVVMASGASVYMSTLSPCGGGQLTSHAGIHRPSSCNRRILISRVNMGGIDSNAVDYTVGEITSDSEWVNVRGVRYATLDGAAPHAVDDTGCQDGWYSIPSGWSVASNTEASLAAVQALPWSASCVVFDDGSSVGTTVEVAHCGSSSLLSAFGDGQVPVHAVNHCSKRILITQAGEVGDVDVTVGPSITHTITFSGVDYAALDNTDPSSDEVGCQWQSLVLPTGWDVAKDSEGTRFALSVVNAGGIQRFGTICLVLSDADAGTSTSIYSSNQESCGDGVLVVRDGVHSVKSCNRRILISRPSTSPSANTNSVDYATPSITTFLSIGGKRFATLDDVDHANDVSGCQSLYLQVPPGWELAAGSDVTAHAAIASGGWGATCLVLADGTSYTTRSDADCGMDQLDEQFGDDGTGSPVTVYRPSSCASGRRILIAQDADPNDVDESVVTITHWATLSEVRYATIDNTPPSASGLEGCGQVVKTVPDGWTLAADTSANREALAVLLEDFGWGTSGMVLGSGVALKTWDPSSTVPGSFLYQIGSYVTPTSCPMRVVITMDSPGEADSGAVPFELVETVTNFISYGGQRFATLNHVHPNTPKSADNCQDETYYAIPEGWELAPHTDTAVAAIASRPWGTDCIALADSTSYQTLTGSECGSAGTLEEERGDSQRQIYRTTKCAWLILITQSADANDDDTSTVEITNSYVFNGYSYASLDNTDPEESVVGCQQSAYQIPLAWEIAPNDEDVQLAVAGMGHLFGTRCLVLEDGSSFYTDNPTRDCSDGSNRLRDFGGTYYTIRTCDRRILIRKPEAESVPNSWEHQVLITRTAEANGWLFGTLENTDPYSHDNANGGCQRVPMAIPDGWEIVTDVTDAATANVLGNAFKQPSCVGLGDGHAYDRRGDVCKSDAVVNLGDYWVPTLCSIEVIVKKKGVDHAECSSWGDPHVTTFDGTYYDFYEVGEYRMARTSDGYIDVQMRTFVTALASSNDAVAAKMGDTLLRIYVGDDLEFPDVFVDDQKIADLENGVTEIQLSDDITLRKHGEMKQSDVRGDQGLLTFEMADTRGNVVWAEVVYSVYRVQYMHIYVNLVEGFNDVEGVCLSWDYNMDNDLPDLGPEATVADVIKSVADDNEVTNTPESLFDTESLVDGGELDDEWTDDTGDWTPIYDVESFSLCDREMASQQCDNRGLTGDFYKSCVFDVILTGHSSATDVQSQDTSQHWESSCPATAIDIDVDHVVRFMGVDYAVLGNVDPEEEESGCQTGTLRIPDGWETAPDTPLSRAAVWEHTWATDCMVLGSGASVSTSGASGECEAEGALERGGPGLLCARVHSCNSRILLYRVAEETTSLGVNLNLNQLDTSDETLLMGWEAFGVGYEPDTDTSRRLDYDMASAKVERVNAASTTRGGAKQRMDANFDQPTPFSVTAYSKAEGVEGNPGPDYSLFVDVYFTDDADPSFGHVAKFNVGTHCWEGATVDIVFEDRVVDYIIVHLVFGESMNGTVWFDDVVIGPPTGNIVANPNFRCTNEDTANPSLVDWDAYGSGFDYLDEDEMVRCSSQEEGSTQGVIQVIPLQESESDEGNFDQRRIYAACRSKAEDVSGSVDYKYSLYVDIWFVDGTALYGRNNGFDVGSHEWQLRDLSIPIDRPVEQIQIGCLFSEHSGTVLFDDAYVGIFDGSGVTSAVSYGDPHLVTYDGLAYDIQQIGEYVLTSVGGSHNAHNFEVQVRHSIAGMAAVTSGMAVRCPESSSPDYAPIVSVERAEDNGATTLPSLRVDGSEVVLESGNSHSLPNGGGKVTLTGHLGTDTLQYSVKCAHTGPRQGYEVTVSVFTSSFGVQFFTVLPTLASTAAGVSGLLGNNNGDPSDDIVDAFGNSVETFDSYRPTQSGYRDMVTQFAERFTVTDETSMFTYAAGLSHDDFVDEEFWREPLTLDAFTQTDQDEAFAACAPAGITGDVLLGCMLDYLYSSADPAFAKGTNAAQTAVIPSASFSATAVIESEETAILPDPDNPFTAPTGDALSDTSEDIAGGDDGGDAGGDNGDVLDNIGGGDDNSVPIAPILIGAVGGVLVVGALYTLRKIKGNSSSRPNQVRRPSYVGQASLTDLERAEGVVPHSPKPHSEAGASSSVPGETTDGTKLAQKPSMSRAGTELSIQEPSDGATVPSAITTATTEQST